MNRAPRSSGAPSPAPEYRRLASRRIAAASMSEDELLAAVRELAQYAGFLTYHTHDSRHSEKGWPDLVLASRAQRRLIVAELKDADGEVTDEQQEWLDLLALCGVETAVWRPADLQEVIPQTLRRRSVRPAGIARPRRGEQLASGLVLARLIGAPPEVDTVAGALLFDYGDEHVAWEGDWPAREHPGATRRYLQIQTGGRAS